MLYNLIFNFQITVVSPFLAHESIRNIFLPLLCLHLCFIHIRLIQFAYIDILHTKLISVILRIWFCIKQYDFCVFERIIGEEVFVSWEELSAEWLSSVVDGWGGCVYLCDFRLTYCRASHYKLDILWDQWWYTGEDYISVNS